MYKSIIIHNSKVDTGAAGAAPPGPTYQHQWLVATAAEGGGEGCRGGGLCRNCVGWDQRYHRIKTNRQIVSIFIGTRPGQCRIVTPVGGRVVSVVTAGVDNKYNNN